MKKFLIFTIFATMSHAISTPIKLPTADELRKRLEANGFSEYSKATGLAERLGSKKIGPMGVILAVDATFTRRNIAMNPQAIIKAIDSRNKIIAVILQDYCNELAALQNAELC